MFLHRFGWKCTVATAQKCSHKACLFKKWTWYNGTTRAEFNPLSQVLPARSLKEKQSQWNRKMSKQLPLLIPSKQTAVFRKVHNNSSQYLLAQRTEHRNEPYRYQWLEIYDLLCNTYSRETKEDYSDVFVYGLLVEYLTKFKSNFTTCGTLILAGTSLYKLLLIEQTQI